MLTSEAEHLHHANTLCQLLAKSVRNHLERRSNTGDPSPNAIALELVASIFAGELDLGLVPAIRELATIEGVSELRLAAAAAIRRAAETSPGQNFGTYHAFARVIDPSTDHAIVRLIQGAID